MQRVNETRGRARQFWRVFERSHVPMVIVDNNRVHLEANAAARLLFRLSLAELRERRIDDLTPPHMLDTLYTSWAALMAKGAAAGPYESAFPDGSRLRSVYSALANVLPGQHLIALAPADWPAGELSQDEGDVATSPRRRISRREREVLNLIAAGADRREIAEELTISVATVRTHVRNLLHKLNARNRAHAIALAIQQGLIELPAPAGAGPGA